MKIIKYSNIEYYADRHYLHLIYDFSNFLENIIHTAHMINFCIIIS